LYLNKWPVCNEDVLVEHLKELSLNNIKIQIEFDKFKNLNNVEIEFYIKNGYTIKNSFLEISSKVKSLQIEEGQYSQLLKELVWEE